MANPKHSSASTIGSLARVVLQADDTGFSPHVMRQAQLLLLDTIGCGIAGSMIRC